MLFKYKSFCINLFSWRFFAFSKEDGLSSFSLYSRELFQVYYEMEYLVLFSGMEGLEHTGDGNTKNYQISAMTVSYSHL